MPESMNNKSADIYAQFNQWLDSQPYWLQDATYRIFNGLDIGESQLSIYVDMCISQAQKQKIEYKHLEPNGLRGPRSSFHMTIQKLYDIDGVNALATDASLEFLPKGITVVYGLNGAGKSSFMRIFKQLSGSPFEEAIQPNVFKKTVSRKQSCSFLITEDDSEREVYCDLTSEQKDTPLANCDVFDTRISNDYIRKNNNVSYQPFVFTVLTELANIADRISKEVERRKKKIDVTPVELPKAFSERDDIEWVKELSATTSFPKQFTAWSDHQQQLLENITRQLDTEKTTNDLCMCKSQLGMVNPILEDLIAAKKAIKDPAIPKAYKTFVETKQRLSIAKKLFAETANDYDKVSINIEDWKVLWQTAQRYYNSVIYSEGSNGFGEDGSVCPLCHQLIQGKTASRFKNVNEYVNGTCNLDYDRAEKNLKRFLSKVTSRSYSEGQIRTQLLTVLDEAELSLVEAAYSALGTNNANGSVEIEYARLSGIDIDEVIVLLSDKKRDLETKQKDLEIALEDERRSILQKQLFDLQYHKWLFDNKTHIENEIDKLKERQKLVDTKPFLTTNRITSEANHLANVVITDAYIERFANELNKLAPQIKVKLEKAPSQKGSTPYKVMVDTESSIKCKPEDILSEGEQRIVALAAFFADATGRETETPIIIDDPISSLDINYERTATNRIVELALDRQIIVFTHRISMLTGIKETCHSFGVQYKENYIRSTLNGKGVSDFTDVYRGSIKAHLKGIKTRIVEIKKMDPDSADYTDAIGKQCREFRICVERSVEDILLQGMVRRFERNIITKGKVTKLPRMTMDDCKIVDSMMSKYSFTEHSQPIDSPPVQISIEELSCDIDNYLNWINDYNKRMGPK